MTAEVEAELHEGLHRYPHLQQVLEARWIRTEELRSTAELTSFADFAARLVVGTRNVGEASVLAYAAVHDCVAVVDDGAARKAAHDFDVKQRGTLGLLCEAIREGLLTVDVVSDIADHLLESEYRLPFGPGNFRAWARENGLVPPDR
ncbi:nucleotide-binding protein [Pseudactinotalea sp. HY160]|uniref:nucleotide-binding protein n=2 Tax=unclassified Pseudactinotalea TaxID=2649176 RepID=UPI001D153808|nr:nucleotide-binding protein [Pseudactinotalea sp. HY160]